jgi:dephospho-CoA kinase
MLRVGVTGGLACGKTTVSEMMTLRGAHVVQADKVAHELMRPGQAVYDAVVKLFGREIVNPSTGEIDRAKLADTVFGSGRIKELNAIVHPAVIDHQQQWMEELEKHEPSAIAVWEAALILEADVRGRFDKIVVVTCPTENKFERWVKRTVAPNAGPLAVIKARKEAQRRMAAQIPDEEKIRAADYVIDNGGSMAKTEQQVEKLMQELKSLV